MTEDNAQDDGFPALYHATICRLLDSIGRGLNICAIKDYRTATGCSLRAAKDAIDGFRAALGTNPANEEAMRMAREEIVRLRAEVASLQGVTQRGWDAAAAYRDALRVALA